MSETKYENATIAILTLCRLPISIIWGGFVLSCLWLWFMVQLGLMEINLWHAAGLGMILQFCLSKIGPEKEDMTIDGAYRCLRLSIIQPAIVLALGYIVFFLANGA